MVSQIFQNLDWKIAKICAISGTPGLSWGVLKNGEVLHTGNFGFRDIEAQLPTTSNTGYHIGSLSKAFTAAAMGILVEDGKTTWETSVREIMGEDFHFSDRTLSQEMSILDVLSHKMGLQRSNQLWHGNDNTLLLNKNKVLSHVQYLQAVQPFRSTLHYSNWGYALAGAMIEYLSGNSWGEFVESNLLNPLQMNNTSTKRLSKADHDQIAKPYTALNDRSFCPLPPVLAEDGTIMDSAMGIRSTVNDLLKWSQALNKAYNDQQKMKQGWSPGSPLKQIPIQMAALTPFLEPFDSGSHYGMGWVRAQLPTVFGAIGCNPSFVKSLPTAGHGSSEVVIYHQGSTAGYTSSLFLIPSTESAIVVLSNSISLNDCADWVGQLILEALLDVKQPNDYIKYAQESADGQLAKFPSMQASLEESRIPHTKPKELGAYVGRYYNQIRDFFIEVTMTNNSPSESLEFAFQGLDSQVWRMEHYHHDSFLWLMSRDEYVRRARFPYSPAKLFKFDFLTDERGEVDSLLWAHDIDGPPERFCRDMPGGSGTVV